jgi:hypothetical protein
MSIIDIIIKILLFLGVFYGAIAITSWVSKKIRDKENESKKS